MSPKPLPIAGTPERCVGNPADKAGARKRGWMRWECSIIGSADGVSRKETPSDLLTFITEAGRVPLITPSVVQRLDLHPSVELPFSFGGWTFTATAGARATYYSNSIDPTTQLVSPRDVIRGYAEFEFDIRPPALARNFRRSDGSVSFRHVIEPYVIFRRVTGINNFNQIIRFDYLDAIANTSEIEYGITNRFFTKRSTESAVARIRVASPR